MGGKRVTKSESFRSSSMFSKIFSLDPNVDMNQFKANLNNGVLVVSAPKDLNKLEENNNVRRIPITSVEGTLTNNSSSGGGGSNNNNGKEISTNNNDNSHEQDKDINAQNNIQSNSGTTAEVDNSAISDENKLNENLVE